MTTEDRHLFRQRFLLRIRLCTQMGLASHLFIMYVCLMLTAVPGWERTPLLWMQGIFVTLNLAHVAMLHVEDQMHAFVTKALSMLCAPASIPSCG